MSNGDPCANSFNVGALADAGFYKGVIYKTNEKSRQFVDIRGVFYEVQPGKKEKQQRHSSPIF